MKHTIRNIEFILGAEKEMFWPEQSTLIISDLHLGKIKHFSSNGIQVPRQANENNYWRLSQLLSKYSCKRVIFLGDLFHSEKNSEWEKFIDFLQNYPKIDWVLIKGNHDILDENSYEKAGLEVVSELIESGIIFTHEPIEEKNVNYNICGHIHPAIRMKGAARQSLRLPCFYFGFEIGIMPAFGEFTGTHGIQPKKGEKVFVLADNEIVQLC